MTKRILIFLLTITFSLSAFPQKSLKELTKTYDEALKKWEVPGMAIAIIKNDSLILSETLDFLLEEESEYDWNAYFLEQNEKYEERAEQMTSRQDSLRKKNTTPSLALEQYAGTYSGELYGNAEIKMNKGGSLELQMLPSPKFHSTLKHWHHDTFMIKFEAFPSLPRGWVTFVLDRHGNVHEMKIDVPNPDFDFTELEFIQR